MWLFLYVKWAYISSNNYNYIYIYINETFTLGMQSKCSTKVFTHLDDITFVILRWNLNILKRGFVKYTVGYFFHQHAGKWGHVTRGVAEALSQSHPPSWSWLSQSAKGVMSAKPPVGQSDGHLWSGTNYHSYWEPCPTS